MSKNNDQLNGKDFLIGTMIGAVVGAGIALLFAPKSGREIRGKITIGAQKAMECANDFKYTAQIKGTKWKDKAVELGNEIKEKTIDSTAQFTKKVATKTRDFKDTANTKLQRLRNKEDATLEAVEQLAQTIDETAEKLTKE